MNPGIDGPSQVQKGDKYTFYTWYIDTSYPSYTHKWYIKKNSDPEFYYSTSGSSITINPVESFTLLLEEYNPNNQSQWGYVTKYVTVIGDEPKISVNSNLLIPAEYEVKQNYPNPFNPSTTLKFGIPEKSKVNVIIYDILGMPVKTLANNIVYSAGYHVLHWDGKNDYGIKASSGVYICRFKMNNRIFSKKILLMK